MDRTQEHLRPTVASQRVSVIDSLRGFAIFGILVVNVIYFFNSWYTPVLGVDAPPVDTVVKFVTNTFFVSKFFTLFSFLFGLGLFIQMSRARAKGTRFLPVYLRRLAILAIFGLGHAVFLWVGDILFLYALLGLVTALLFRNRGSRALLVWAIIFMLLPIVFVTVSTGMIELARSAPPETGAYEQVEAGFAEQQAFLADLERRGSEIYRSGSYGEVTRWRAQEFLVLLSSSNFFMAPTVLAMFLLGLRAGKEGWFTDIEGKVPRFRRFLRWGLPAGLLLNLVVGLSGFDLNTLGTTVLTWEDTLMVAALNIGAVLLSLSYVTGMILLSRTASGTRLLAPLAPVGRMALTNYILHSVVMSTLAYGYGAGLYGRIDLWVGFLLALLLYLAQIPLSGWWFRRYRFGPLEWLWRVLTYGGV